MASINQEESDSSTTEEIIATEVIDTEKKLGKTEDVILESIDDSDVSSVQSLPDDIKTTTVQTARSLSYTNEFDDLKSGRSTTRRSQTFDYTDDFEDVDPRGAVTDRTEYPTARTLPSTAYSSDFETTLKTSKLETRYSTESFETYTPSKSELRLETTGRSYSSETFESDSLLTERSEESSSTEEDESLTSVSITKTYSSDSSEYEDTFTDASSTTTDESVKSTSINCSLQPAKEDERKFIDAKYDFFVKKLMLLEAKNRGEHESPPAPEDTRPDNTVEKKKEPKHIKSFCQRKMEILHSQSKKQVKRKKKKVPTATLR